MIVSAEPQEPGPSSRGDLGKEDLADDVAKPLGPMPKVSRLWTTAEV